jgi:hypothetical protein
LAKLVEVPKERPLDAPLVASKLGESVPLFGVKRAPEEDLVSRGRNSRIRFAK